jgi:hypothetical protein
MFICISNYSSSEGHTLAQTVRRQLSTKEIRVRPHPSPCDIVVDKATLEQGFLRVLRFSPYCYHTNNAHAHLTRLPVAFAGRTKGKSLGTFQKAMLFRKSRSTGQQITSNF